MTYKYLAVIRNGNSRRDLEAVRADFLAETRNMAEKSAERLMLSNDITAGADIQITLNATGEIVSDYHWPQLRKFCDEHELHYDPGYNCPGCEEEHAETELAMFAEENDHVSD